MNGNHLKAIRLYFKIKQCDFAEQLGVSNGTLSGVESGRVSVRWYMLERMCDAYGLAMLEIMWILDVLSGRTEFEDKFKAVMSEKAINVVKHIKGL